MEIEIKRVKRCNKKLKLFTNHQKKNIKLFNDCFQIASMAMYRSIHGVGFKILTPKNMLQNYQ